MALGALPSMLALPAGVEWIALLLLIFIVAFLYASVGHGGASGYLGVLSFFGFSQAEMASTALMLNIIVAGLAFFAYHQARHFSWKVTWPFILLSIPAAYAGGLMPLSPKVYGLILAITLAFAAWRLGWPHLQSNVPSAIQEQNPLPLQLCLLVGGAIGLLSGMVGIGGGIFLSPVMLLMRWANVKQTSSTAALFIVVNAAAGLLGRFSRHGLALTHLWPLLITAVIGGWLGARYGANHCPDDRLRKILALVLLIAAIKLILLYLR